VCHVLTQLLARSEISLFDSPVDKRDRGRAPTPVQTRRALVPEKAPLLVLLEAPRATTTAPTGGGSSPHGGDDRGLSVDLWGSQASGESRHAETEVEREIAAAWSELASVCKANNLRRSLVHGVVVSHLANNKKRRSTQVRASALQPPETYKHSR
jgi:hypothetical protein